MRHCMTASEKVWVGKHGHNLMVRRKELQKMRKTSQVNHAWLLNIYSIVFEAKVLETECYGELLKRFQG
ncbi:unnamed protein product [Brassica oleracea]